MNYESLPNEELDRLIHERLFPNDHASLCYSSLWESASYVVEAMRERGYEVSLDTDNFYGVWDCKLHKGGMSFVGDDESLPRAIVIAALRALECK